MGGIAGEQDWRESCGEWERLELGVAGKRKLQKRRELQKRSLGSGKREVGGNKWRGMD